MKTKRKYRKGIFCTETGKVWNSMRECSNELGIPYKRLCAIMGGLRINYTTLRPIEGGDELKYEQKVTTNSGRKKQVICTKTLQIWNSARECSQDVGINYRTLVSKLNGNDKNNTTLEYLETYDLNA